MPIRNSNQYFQKAAKYDSLSNYYKYSHPELHIHYYHKHLQHLEKAMRHSRAEAFQPEKPFARLRMLHASPDSPNVDIFINELRIFQDIPFKALSHYLSLPEGKYQIDIYPTGEKVSSMVSKKVTIKGGHFYTLAAAGQADNMRLVSIDDDPFIPAGETKVRFVHLSSEAPSFDIAVQNGDVVFRCLSFRKATDYLGLSPMAVDLEVRSAGTRKVFLTLKGIRFYPNLAYTIYLLGYTEKMPPLEAVTFTP